MPANPSVSVRPSRGGLALRVGLAAALVVGVAAALPSFAAEPVHVDAAGYLELPAPVVSTADYTFDFVTCPDAPPNQGVDAWVYELPAEHALADATVTVSGTDSAGDVPLTAYVYDDACTYMRAERSDAALTFTLEDTDRYLAVATPTGVGTSLLLELRPPVTVTPTQTPTADPTSDPGDGTGPQVMPPGDYSAGAKDPYYAEASTGPVGAIADGGQWGMRIIQVEQAWQQPQATGAGVTVAVLDSGLDTTHEDFQCHENKIVELDPALVAEPSYSRFKDVTDPDGHGTHVAGIVGACTNNGVGVVGAAPDAAILPIQALSPEEATAERLAASIDAAVASGAHVINMSLGFSAQGIPATGSAVALVGGFAGIDLAIKRAVDAGVVVVAAAGNESVPICGYPALAEKVVCVGSSDRRDLNAWYGNFPVTPSGTALLAPGGSGQVFCDVQSENVLSTYSTQVENGCAYPGPGYRGLDGTSMAAPHVAGVAALVYDRLGAQRTKAAGEAVVQALVDSAVDLYTDGYDPMSGEGRVDAFGAVQAVSAVVPTGTPTPTQTTDPERATNVELIAPATAQTSDDVLLEARVSEGDQPVSGAQVQFLLTADGARREVTGTTGDDGVTTATLPLDVAPGSYALSATYAGEAGTRSGSSDDQPFEVTRDDSTTTLVVEGQGSSRTLTVTVADADTAENRLARVPVVLLADGQEIATVTTDDRGVATYTPQGRERSASTYEARFGGDTYYLGSTGRATP